MFKLNPGPTFTVKVSLTVAGADAPAVIDIEFKHKGRAALTAWLETIKKKRESEVLAEIICSWSGPLDDKGEPVPYSAAALDQLTDNYPPSAGELFDAYRKALGESRIKNS